MQFIESQESVRLAFVHVLGQTWRLKAEWKYISLGVGSDLTSLAREWIGTVAPSVGSCTTLHIQSGQHRVYLSSSICCTQIISNDPWWLSAGA